LLSPASFRSRRSNPSPPFPKSVRRRDFIPPIALRKLAPQMSPLRLHLASHRVRRL
jgi:hypothetical protein